MRALGFIVADFLDYFSHIFMIKSTPFLIWISCNDIQVITAGPHRSIVACPNHNSTLSPICLVQATLQTMNPVIWNFLVLLHFSWNDRQNNMYNKNKRSNTYKDICVYFLKKQISRGIWPARKFERSRLLMRSLEPSLSKLSIINCLSYMFVFYDHARWQVYQE